jgi:hypothetical protein
MSYILEALKKSDAERKRGEVPTLSNPQTDPASFTPSSGPSVMLDRFGRDWRPHRRCRRMADAVERC